MFNVACIWRIQIWLIKYGKHRVDYLYSTDLGVTYDRQYVSKYVSNISVTWGSCSFNWPVRWPHDDQYRLDHVLSTGVIIDHHQPIPPMESPIWVTMYIIDWYRGHIYPGIIWDQRLPILAGRVSAMSLRSQSLPLTIVKCYSLPGD
jgi:hypothetical protein